MRIYRSALIIAVFSLQFSTLFSFNIKNNSEILYLSPVPNSKYNTKETNIIIKYKDNVNFHTISKENFRISGTISGEHSFHIVQIDERNTIILQSDVNFTSGEDVKVDVLGNFKTQALKLISPYTFKFSISAAEVKINPSIEMPYTNITKNAEINYNYKVSNISPVFDQLPADFPKISILTKNNPDQGYIFLANFAFGPGVAPYLMVLGNSGTPFMYKRMDAPCADFKVQNNNTFTYFDYLTSRFYATNTSSLTVLDSFYCGNGYSTDVHELLLLPNYHAYLMSYDSQHVDMSKIIPGGDSSAVVSGLIIQELDQNKNVIFQWRSWDHFQITDTYVNLYSHNIDYVHGNAIDLDNDGNVLISSRHMSEITKINRQTGSIIWRWGGKNNQFTFTNDTLKFSFQHAIRNLSNGKYILFDNGNHHTPPFSRAVEYSLDALNKRATLIWQYKNSPNIFAGAMGNAQRLPSGNTVIGWGSASTSIIEVNPDGTKVFELTMNGQISYRAFRFMWDGAPPQIPLTHILAQNFPNPFNPFTTINFGISANGYVTLKVYDLLGREVKTLVQENLEAGRYTVNFDSQGFASGVYFYKLSINGFTDTKKMVVIK